MLVVVILRFVGEGVRPNELHFFRILEIVHDVFRVCASFVVNTELQNNLNILKTVRKIASF